MNTLLKRQIRKYFPEEYLADNKFSDFLEAISKSYDNSEEKNVMTQRAMKISSDELFEVNEQLRAETIEQKELLNNLRQTLKTLGFLDEETDGSLEVKNLELNPRVLAKTIRDQAEQLVEVNTKQEKLLQELAVQNQELNDYTHIVSHDLKTPLRSIDTLLNWLKEDHSEGLNEEALRYLNNIEDQVEKMDDLISGILRYSSIDKTLNNEKTLDLNVLVKDIVSKIAVPSNINISVHKLPMITADAFKLTQLFENLISNAIASIDKKTGLINIESESIDGFWKFSVTDNGVGIKEAYFDKIFEVFQKLENDSPSTGIGLSIVKKIVTHYGGVVWLESQENVGTTFYFTLKKD